MRPELQQCLCPRLRWLRLLQTPPSGSHCTCRYAGPVVLMKSGYTIPGSLMSLCKDFKSACLQSGALQDQVAIGLKVDEHL